MSLARPASFLILLSCALGLPAAAPAQAVHTEDLRYPPLPKFEIPRPERVVLDNGLVVMLLEDHELPLVEVTAVIRAGGRFDPADKIGLSKLGAQVLRTGGSETRPGDQLDDWLEGRGAVLEANADGDAARAVLSSLAQDFPDSLRVFADAQRVSQVLTNLLSNAHKYSPANSAIEVRTVRSGDECLVTVRDQGPGVPPEERELIFERFYRSTQHRQDRTPSTGLGLPIARKVAEMHKGRVCIEPAPSGGSVFTLALPLS